MANAFRWQKFFWQKPLTPLLCQKMSAPENISEIKKLPARQREKGFRFVDEELRRAGNLADNTAAEQTLAGPGENFPWEIARNKLGWA
jgi:hypothetical protein